MIKGRRKQLIQIYLFGDILAVLLAFNFTFWLRFQSGLVGVPKGVPSFSHYLIIIPAFLAAHLLYFASQGYYKIKLRRNRLDDIFLVLINSIVTAFIILLLVSYLKSYKIVNFEISHLFLFIYVPASVILIFSLRLLIFKIFKLIYLKKNGVSRVLIAGTEELSHLIAEKLRKYSHFGIEVCGFLGPQSSEGVLGNFNDFERVVRKYGITDLYIALSLKEYNTIMKLIETGNNLLIDIRLVPDILQLTSLKAGMEHIEGVPTIHLGDIPLQGIWLYLKRLFDILFSCVAIILSLPFLFIIALVIKLTSKGPIFYKQVRVGLDGRNFKMLKFRTMIDNAEKETGAIWSPPDDQRITGIGKVLRKLSLDEIPQMLNVLKGDMSMVGPRPERPELVSKFMNNIPKYMLRHRVKTGVTGWAQVHGLRGNTPLDKRIEFDIYYIQNWTLKLDLEILWRTVFKLKFIDKSN